METGYIDTGLIWIREHRGSSIAYRVIWLEENPAEYRLMTKTLGATTFSKFPPFQKVPTGILWESTLVLDKAGYEFLNCQSFILSQLLDLASQANCIDVALRGNKLTSSV